MMLYPPPTKQPTATAVMTYIVPSTCQIYILSSWRGKSLYHILYTRLYIVLLVYFLP